MSIISEIAGRLPAEEILCQCAEECAELSQAVLKLRRAMAGTTPVTPYRAIASVNEEAADVLNLLDALRAIGATNAESVDGIRAYKARRWHARVFGEGCRRTRRRNRDGAPGNQAIRVHGGDVAVCHGDAAEPVEWSDRRGSDEGRGHREDAAHGGFYLHGQHGRDGAHGLLLTALDDARGAGGTQTQL